MKKEYPIYWSPEAEETYLKTLTYILEKWTIREAEDFEWKVESLLTKLSRHKYLCPPSNTYFQNSNTIVVYIATVSYTKLKFEYGNWVWVWLRKAHNSFTAWLARGVDKECNLMVSL